MEPVIGESKEVLNYQGDLYSKKREVIGNLETAFIVSGNYIESIFLRLAREARNASDEKLRLKKSILTVSLLGLAPLAKAYRYITRSKDSHPDYIRFRNSAISGFQIAENELTRRGY